MCDNNSQSSMHCLVDRLGWSACVLLEILPSPSDLAPRIARGHLGLGYGDSLVSMISVLHETMVMTDAVSSLDPPSWMHYPLLMPHNGLPSPVWETPPPPTDLQARAELTPIAHYWPPPCGCEAFTNGPAITTILNVRVGASPLFRTGDSYQPIRFANENRFLHGNWRSR